MEYALTFLILSSVVSLSGPETVSAFESFYPGRMAYIREIEEGPKNSRVFTVNGVRVIVGYTTDRLKSGITEHALETVQSWEGGREAFQAAEGHVLIGLDQEVHGHEQMAAGATAVTLLAGALTARLPISAVLIADSELVVRPEIAKERAASLANDGTLPVDLWVSTNPIYAESDDGKTSNMIITRGLKRFVGREIEITSDKVGFDTLANRAHDLSSYLIKRGPVVGDGHTIGYSATEHIRVRHLNPGLSGEPALGMQIERAEPMAARGR